MSRLCPLCRNSVVDKLMGTFFEKALSAMYIDRVRCSFCRTFFYRYALFDGRPLESKDGTAEKQD